MNRQQRRVWPLRFFDWQAQPLAAPSARRPASPSISGQSHSAFISTAVSGHANCYHPRLHTSGLETMNRQKKLQQLFKAKAKKANAKLAPKSKDKYISKAERERLANEAAQTPDASPQS